MALTAPATYEFGDDFQRHALAVLARIPGGIVRYRSALDPTFFGSATLRTIAEVLFAHVDEHKGLPQKATLLEALSDQVGDEDFKRVQKSVNRMYDADVSDGPAVLKRVIEFGRQQAYVNATLKAAEELERGNREVRKYFDAAGLVGEDLLDLGIDYRRNVKARREYYLDPSAHEDRISTGLPHLDVLMGGGLCRKELGVVLAPPKRGKTTTLINIAYGAFTAPTAYNVAHYSLEMHQDKVARRYDDRLMGKHVDIRSAEPEKYGRILSKRVKTFVRGRLFVKHYPTRTASVSKIRSHLTLLSARGFTPDLIVVDYADIMKPERRLGEMRHEQAGIYEDLRQLADEFNAAVWTGSQASRGALEKETVTIEDFAEAFEKAAIVDAAIAFCQTNDERVESRCRLYAAALRNAEDGRTIECAIDRNRARLRSIALFDVSGARILLQGEQHDANLETTSFVAKAKRKEEATEMKKRAGIKVRGEKRKDRPVVGVKKRRREPKPSKAVT